MRHLSLPLALSFSTTSRYVHDFQFAVLCSERIQCDIIMVEPAIIVPHVDWATIGSATERRRRQNRINQRAQRE
jgi:hypothetical protein